MGADMKADLHRYLQRGREDLLWQLDGASEYDVRRPLTPTGTNLLGLVEHPAGAEAGRLGLVFGRPFAEPLSWVGRGRGTERGHVAHRRGAAGTDHRALPAGVVPLRRHGPALELDTPGRAPSWWPEERRDVTLHRVPVHVIAETNRHAGRADIARELADGAVGLRRNTGNMAPGDPTWWKDHRERLERIALQFGPEVPEASAPEPG